MDWIYEKYLRNVEREEVEARYLEEATGWACGMRCSPPQYPMRSSGKRHFVPIGGFKEHPNESQNM